MANIHPLRAYLDRNDLTVAAFAREIKVSVAVTVFRYMSSDRIPAPPVMKRIVAATNGEIQPNDFYGPPPAGGP